MNDENELYCPECGALISSELVELLKRNKKVYCERCGLSIEYSIYKNAIESKSEKTIQKESHISVHELKVKSQDLEKTQSNRDQTTITVQKHNKVPDKNIIDLEKAIKFFNDLNKSPLLYIIIIAVTIGRLIGLAPSFNAIVFIDTIITLIVFLLVLSKISSIVSSEIPAHQYNNLGIELIIYGGIASSIFGLGVIILIEGVLILILNLIKRYNEVYDLNLIDNQDQYNKYKYITLEFNSRAIHVLKDNLVYATFLLLILSIRMIYVDISGDQIINVSELVFFFIGWIFYSYIKRRIVYGLKNITYDKISENLMIGTIIFSAICLANGVGILTLILCVLIMIQKLHLNEVKKQVDELESEYQVQTSSVTLNENIKNVDNTRSQIQESKSSVQQNNEKNLSQPEEIQLINSLNQQDLKEKSKSSKNDKPKEEQLNLYLNKIFTVLSGEIRQKILQLNISEEEKNSILEEFVYLTEEQQQKYLEELESLNKEISSNFIEKVMKSDLNEKDKNYIIKTIQYMNPDTQKEFLHYIFQTDDIQPK